MKTLNPIYLLVLLLVFFVAACTEEDVGMEGQLTGTWKLSSKTVDEMAVVLSECEKQNILELQDYNFCLMIDGCTQDTVFSGWNYTYDMLSISVLLPAAFYVEQIDATSLVLKRNDITSEGELQETTLSYLRNP